MPRKTSVRKSKVAESEEVAVVAPVEAVVAEAVVDSSLLPLKVTVVDINGKKYNQTFNPNDGTTSVELIVE